MHLVYQAAPASSSAAPDTSAQLKQEEKPAQAPAKPKQDAQAATTKTDTATTQQLPDPPAMPVTMNQVLWVAFGFTCALIILSAATLWFPPKRGSNSRAV
jgi:hypothetical protein